MSSKHLDGRIAQHAELVEALKQVKQLSKKNKSLQKNLAKSERQLRKSRSDRVKKVEKLRARLDDREDEIAELKRASAKNDEIMATQRHRIEELCDNVDELNIANNYIKGNHIRLQEVERENAKLRANEARMKIFVENLNLKK